MASVKSEKAAETAFSLSFFVEGNCQTTTQSFDILTRIFSNQMLDAQTNCLHDKLMSGNIDVKIEKLYFRLHYGATVTFLLAFSLIVTTRQYVGNPIDCVHTKDIPEDVLNTYCWIHSTYTIPSAFWKRIGGQGTAGMVRVVTVTVQVLMLLTPASTRQ